MDFKKYVGITPDFPIKGISFKDISPLLADKDAFKACVEALEDIANKYQPDVIVGPEARGFLFGTALAYKMGLGFIMARKDGKLPGNPIKISYDLEYGSAILAIPENIIKKGDRVLLIDDLLATGGTFNALADLVRKAGGEPVCALTVIELTEVYKEGNLSIPHDSLIKYAK